MQLTDMEMRAVYGTVLNELIERNPNVYCVEADLSKASGTNPRVTAAHPANFVNVGVSEANMIGVAAGLASEGKVPFCASFSCFASRRVYDQITISVAYANNNVKIVGTAPGITAGPNGGTHMCFQDLAIMRAMPNMQVFSPCDPYELRAVLHYMAADPHPTYMQLIRSRVTPLFDATRDFDPNRAVVVQEGGDVTLVSTGYMTQVAVPVARQLAAEGIAVELLHYPSVKPFDEATLLASARKTGAVVTVENQSVLGGLGGAVCEVLAEQCPTRVRRLGVPDRFGEVATEEYLFDKHGFGPAQIAAACRAMTGERQEGPARRVVNLVPHRGPSTGSGPWPNPVGPRNESQERGGPTDMRIALGSVVKGFVLKTAVKAHLIKRGHEVLDVGCHDTGVFVKFPSIGQRIAAALRDGRADLAVNCCGSGTGASLAAGKFRGVCAVSCESVKTARLARVVNDANVLCLGESVVSPDLACEMVDAFLESRFQSAAEVPTAVLAFWAEARDELMARGEPAASREIEMLAEKLET
ncbi:MAG: RpiB/LacA/LacB family sugar-phosphate isomerase [Kiritimatiellae bacterium]|nr:RpiB/LacA/LacB family sugar-phosphate isomerase [Kiritimatiellia bacterium]